jgi:predicted metalloprotease with PDZ domain
VAAIDKVKLHRITKFIADMETNFWGGAPYDHYVWHFVAFKRPDGGWGLEHLASTQIVLATGFGPGTDGVLSHEFFHAWNVKRIRSQPLGPFNYQELPQTGALWWLEGVTDYYAHTLLRRYGWTDDPRFYHVIATQVSAVRGNDQRFKISPYDSSFKVRDANNGRGNSNGLGVSYYNTGWLVGLCLDMAIREKTSNKKSLDDVAHNLFKKYGHDQPGFPEDGIRTELVNVGGPSLGDMYDQIVMKPGELPVEDALAKVGLTLNQTDEQYAKLGFRTRPNQEANGLDVLEPDASTGLKEGDLVVGINGQMFAGKTMMQVFTTMLGAVNSPEVGKVIHLSIKRVGSADPVAVDVTPAAATRKVWVVAESPNATTSQMALRKSWLSPPKNWTPPASN